MQLHVTADLLPAESPARPRLDRVLELVSQVTEEGRNAVRGLRSPHGGPQDLEQAFSRIACELDYGQAVDFRVIVEGAPIPLLPLLRDDVYRIGREAMVNAYRHSGAAKIEVEIEFSPAMLRILVRDNGRGIDPHLGLEAREGHWGMQGMRERAERIGAKLRIWTRAAAGTEVELSVPGHLAFPPSASRRRTSWLARLAGRQGIKSE